MANSGAFVLPAGVKLSLAGDTLSIENAGDIVIEGAPAQKLGSLTSTGGDVVLALPGAVRLQSIQAGAGKVTVSGKVQVDVITARDVDFPSGTLKVGVIKASGAVTLSGSKVEANVVVADTVTVDPGLKGRATAVQSNNELGPHKLKGGFSLSEFVDLMPNGAELLEEHDIAVPEDDDDDDDDDDDEEDEEEDARDGPDEDTAADEVAPTPVEALAVVAEPSLDPEVADQVGEALEKIRAAYEDDFPPPIERLGALIDDGDFEALKGEINTIWSDLLKHHQQTGLYISNTVTHMFQTIQLLMRKVA